MKKLLIRIGIVLVMLLILNWVYSRWFLEKDLRKHSDIVELSWQVTDDSCRIIYLGESSNSHYGDEESFGHITVIVDPANAEEWKDDYIWRIWILQALISLLKEMTMVVK